MCLECFESVDTLDDMPTRTALEVESYPTSKLSVVFAASLVGVCAICVAEHACGKKHDLIIIYCD